MLGYYTPWEELEEYTCPVCDGPGVPIGDLGRLSWFRCRYCGMDFNVETKEAA